jgi:DeoR family fructose operon transcriptional repressor
MVKEVEEAAELDPGAPRSVIARSVIESIVGGIVEVIDELRSIEDVEPRQVAVVGGGSRVPLMHELLSERARLPVVRGSQEATALGNALVQGLAIGVFDDLGQAREWGGGGVNRRTFNSPEERLGEVRDLISEKGAVRIDQLAADFGVSEMTIRRDLDELEALGVARRVRGGAIALGPEPFAQRHRHNARAKGRIADKLVDLIPSVGTVAFDASTTVHRLSASLETARDLVIVTNGLDTFHAAVGKPGITASLTGGTQEPRTGSLVGPIAARAAQGFLYDAFVCSAAALDHIVGSSEASLAESEVKRAFAATSSRIILAVDHSKLGTRAQARMFDLVDIDLLVTDLDPGDERLGPYRSLVTVA